MKLRAWTLVLVTGVTLSPAPAPSASQNAEQATVCDIVNHPSSFIGKTVQIRAQIWPDHGRKDQFWLNESSIQFGKACRFLPATFATLTDLAGQTAYGTFRGRVVRKLSRQQSVLFSPGPKELQIIFIIEHQSDIYLSRMYLSGPVPMLQLYDPPTASFVRPEE